MYNYDDEIDEFNDNLEDDLDEIDIDMNDDSEDVFESLEYIHTCQVMTKDDIIKDINSYLKKYQPEYKIVKRKVQN